MKPVFLSEIVLNLLVGRDVLVYAVLLKAPLPFLNNFHRHSRGPAVPIRDITSGCSSNALLWIYAQWQNVIKILVFFVIFPLELTHAL